MSKISTLKMLPSHIKKDDGYYYEEKYVNKVFRYEDNLIWFTDKAYKELPLEVFEKLKESIIEEFMETSQFENLATKAELDSKYTQLEQLIKNNKKHQEDIDNVLNDLNFKYDSILKINESFATSEQLDEKIDNLVSGFKEELQKLQETFDINKKSDDEENELLIKLSKEYEKLKSEIDNRIHEINDKQCKPKMTTLAMLKELGYNSEEIKELLDNGLI